MTSTTTQSINRVAQDQRQHQFQDATKPVGSQYHASELGTNWALVRGNIGRAPEYRETSRGTAMLTMSVAVDRLVKPVAGRGPKRVQTDWFNITLFGELVEQVGPQLERGKNVTVVGRISVRRGSDAQLYYGIVAEDVQVNNDRGSYTQVRFGGKLGLDPVWFGVEEGDTQTPLSLELTVGNYDGSRNEYKGREYPTSPVTYLVGVVEGELARKLKRAESQSQRRLQIGQEVGVSGRLVVERYEGSVGQPLHQQFLINITQLEVFEPEEEAVNEDGEKALAQSPTTEPLPQASAAPIATAVGSGEVVEPDFPQDIEGSIEDLEVLNNPHWQARQEPTQHLAALDREDRAAYRAMLRTLSPLADALRELIWYTYDQHRKLGLEEGASWWLAQSLFIERVARLGLITQRQKRDYANLLIELTRLPGGIRLGQYNVAQLQSFLKSAG